jgi:hypothetical protein
MLNGKQQVIKFVAVCPLKMNRKKPRRKLTQKYK